MPQIASKRPFGNGPVQGGPDPFYLEKVENKISSSETLRTAQPPSCIELYRDDNRVFVVGTYKLLDNDPQGDSEAAEAAASKDKTQKRIGSILLIRLDPTYTKIEEKVEVKLQRAVFDLHFHPKHHDLLGVATSSERVSFFKFNASPLSLQYLFSLPVHEDSTALATFFAWSPFPSAKGTISFAVTFSDGWVSYFDDVPLNPPRKKKRSVDAIALKSHDLEAWFLAFTLTLSTESGSNKPAITRRILSGGDDATLIANNIPTVGLKGGTQSATVAFTDNRIHSAGVTAILPLPSLRTHLGPSSDLILTGSYDEHLRLISISSMHPFQRKVLADIRLDGGVWRLKYLTDVYLDTVSTDTATKSKLCFVVLASCMHAGPKVVRFTCSYTTENKDQQTWKTEVLAEFGEHESMNYGSDWTVDEKGNFVVVSTSFYDARICIWKPFEASG